MAINVKATAKDLERAEKYREQVKRELEEAFGTAAVVSASYRIKAIIAKVIADEREACAIIADECSANSKNIKGANDIQKDVVSYCAKLIASAIRKRGQNEKP